MAHSSSPKPSKLERLISECDFSELSDFFTSNSVLTSILSENKNSVKKSKKQLSKIAGYIGNEQKLRARRSSFSLIDISKVMSLFDENIIVFHTSRHFPASCDKEKLQNKLLVVDIILKIFEHRQAVGRTDPIDIVIFYDCFTKDNMDTSFSNYLFDVLKNFPFLIGKAYMVNPPRMVKVAVKIAKPFLGKFFKEKVEIVTSLPEQYSHLQ
ncbi:hypothetical protein PCE1_002628 [Barthelona sp. PCE]